MLNNRVEILRGILIGSTLFLCSILLIITIYLLYHYRQKTIDLHDKQINRNQSKEEIIDPLNTNSPTIIEELMRKSLQLAQTAEQVADHNEKRFSLKDNIHLNL